MKVVVADLQVAIPCRSFPLCGHDICRVGQDAPSVELDGPLCAHTHATRSFPEPADYNKHKVRRLKFNFKPLNTR
jgi:hypothetical protein